MRTTNKAFKVQVQEHIINCLGEEFETVEGNLQFVVDEFQNWYCAYEQKRNPNKQEAFIDWLNGLPSCLNVEFSSYNIYETLKKWFETCGEVYKEQSEDKEARTYRCLIYREFNVLCKQYGIEF